MAFKPYAPEPSQRADEPSVANSSPAADRAEKILRQAPELDDQTRATLWEVYHSKATPDELAKVLDNFSVSNDTKHRLWEAKKMTAPEPTPLDRTRKAIESVSKLDSDMVKIAESHPTVLKALADAMMPKSKA